MTDGLLQACLIHVPRFILALCCSHVFETVDDDKAADSSRAAVEGQIKAVEQLLEDLRKRRGSSS